MAIADGSGQGTGPTTRSHRGSMPTALVGRWSFAAATGQYCDPLGDCAPGSGGSITFTFRAGGRAEYSLFQSSLVAGCGQVQSLRLTTGTARTDGSTLVFTPKSGTYKSFNGCRPDLTGNWKLAAEDLKPVSFSWQLDDGALQLVDPTGEASGTYNKK
ncbi:hypothetical protein RFM41_08375 [Mesorhizobium sp. VK25A]|uniref:Lipocalin-like domain-containing protein n=1 Tax=Mesorhizobium vachelliae TaxID=3072309 RepID=A0ABU5A6I6_9HYPH|nr:MULTISPECIES: hypothetical protein [unclassified Mesorhizobium]MDX8531806.1 hypothetical protein [Mesorhizobium sp. VK25D]MDX8543751.1 hypothetical protein [Mesorhizobium sp. VK25A]